MPKKLRCDRCGFELSDPEDVELAFECSHTWHASVRAEGGEPRGVFPCENYIRCHGEIVEVLGWRSKAKRLLFGR